jgi:septum formation topological specificity factor MinE
MNSLKGQPKTTGFTEPECFKADLFEKLRKDMIEFIAKHQIPIAPYYMRFIGQELTPENIEKLQNEMLAEEAS